MGFFKRSEVKAGEEGRKEASKDHVPEQTTPQRVGIVSGVLSPPGDAEEETLFGNVVERRFGPGGAASRERTTSTEPPLEIDDETTSVGGDDRPFESPELEVDSMAHIGRSTTITGKVVADEDLEIQGRIEGEIELLSNQVTIGSDGIVQADVRAHSVVVVGRVTGNVSASELVEVKAGGFIGGDVKAPRVIMHDGAIVVGALDMSAALPSAAVDTRGGRIGPREAREVREVEGVRPTLERFDVDPGDSSSSADPLPA